MAVEFGEIAYSLTDWVVAAYDITAGTYGLPSTPQLGQVFEIEHQHDTDMLRGFAVIKRLLSVETHVTINLKMGSLDFDAFATMTGDTTGTSGSTPNQVRGTVATAGGAGLPYFGIIGKAATDDGGARIVGIPICKLDARPKASLNGEENKFIIQEMAGKGIPVTVSSVEYLEHVLGYETASGWSKPTSGAEFLAHFTLARAIAGV